jgi:hypothetical protein
VRIRRLRWSLGLPKHPRILANSATRNFKVSGHSHYQLFQLADDPFEQQYLAATQPDQLRRMMQRLTASLEQHQAVYPVDQDGTTPLKPKLP